MMRHRGVRYVDPNDASLVIDPRGDTMSRRTGSRARIKNARRRAKNPDVKKRKPIDRTAPSVPTFAPAAR